MDGTTRPLAGGCLRDKRAPVEAAIETEKQGYRSILRVEAQRLSRRQWLECAKNGSVIPSPDAGFGMKRNHQELPQEKL